MKTFVNNKLYIKLRQFLEAINSNNVMYVIHYEHIEQSSTKYFTELS